ncbi:TPA: replication protein P [Yersinia enterocolitica]|uniref:replication protein P n=1 Tax=Yersinia enterocolitica TaxID=630 RepID=UPI0002D97D47|nr:replication protein P [Yersinia enterocolitica]
MKSVDLSRKKQPGRCKEVVLARVHSPEHAPSKTTRDARMLFNRFFQKLRIIFPSTVNNIKTQDELDELRRQWTTAFAENRVVNWQQIELGLQRARRCKRPFLPSPGVFIAWIREGQNQRAGLPDLDSVMAEFHRYCALRDNYASPEQFPWKAPVMYWIVIDLRRAMLQYKHSEAIIRKMAERQLKRWLKKIHAGQEVPKPMARLPDQRLPETTGAKLGLVNARTEAQGRAMLNAIRQRIASGSN